MTSFSMWEVKLQAHQLHALAQILYSTKRELETKIKFGHGEICALSHGITLLQVRDLIALFGVDKFLETPAPDKENVS